MQNKIVKIALVSSLAMGLTAVLSGCIGSNAVTTNVMKFNIEVVDNRYARAGVNLLLAPVYGITMAADYIVFNSIEFWAGKNPLNGKPHMFDSKVKTMYEINKDLDPSLTDAPLSKINNVNGGIYSAEVAEVDEKTLDFTITYNNGDKAVVRGEKDGDMVSFYVDNTLITTASMDELASYSAK
tara:strand:+ start:172 stop:720 length:549 start_codon:yes stop_codon:yes gene_type:complete